MSATTYQPHCSVCKFWEPRGFEDSGECRRHAPVSDAFRDGNFYAVWPRTMGLQWCGEGEPTEEAQP